MINIFSRESVRARENFIVVTTFITENLELITSFQPIMIREIYSFYNFGLCRIATKNGEHTNWI